MVMGEFGRTPRINNGQPGIPIPGRDHWGDAISVLMAGGGLKGGQVVGKTTSKAEHPVDRPLKPADVLATAYRVLGIDPAAVVQRSIPAVRSRFSMKASRSRSCFKSLGNVGVQALACSSLNVRAQSDSSRRLRVGLVLLKFNDDFFRNHATCGELQSRYGGESEIPETNPRTPVAPTGIILARNPDRFLASSSSYRPIHLRTS